MEEAIVKTKKIGGSIMVTIPKEIVELESIKEGNFVRIAVAKQRKDFFGALKGIGKFSKEDELNTHD